MMECNTIDYDITYRSQILESAKNKRVYFNPKNKKHRESLKMFLEKGKWGDIQFIAEYPFIDVPSTCLNKLAKHCLKID